MARIGFVMTVFRGSAANYMVQARAAEEWLAKELARLRAEGYEVVQDEVFINHDDTTKLRTSELWSTLSSSKDERS